MESIHSSGNASVISDASGAHWIVEVGDVQLRCRRRTWRGRTDQLTVNVTGWIWKHAIFYSDHFRRCTLHIAHYLNLGNFLWMPKLKISCKVIVYSLASKYCTYNNLTFWTTNRELKVISLYGIMGKQLSKKTNFERLQKYL